MWLEYFFNHEKAQQHRGIRVNAVIINLLVESIISIKLLREEQGYISFGAHLSVYNLDYSKLGCWINKKRFTTPCLLFIMITNQNMNLIWS